MPNVNVRLPHALVERVDQFQADHGLPTRSAAIVALLELGLAAAYGQRVPEAER